MKKYIAKRIIYFVAVLMGVSILSFLLIAFSGKDPAEIIALRSGVGVSKEAIERIRADMGLNKPLPLRYLNWMGGLLTGDFGTSIYTFHPIGEDLADVLPVTMSLVGLSLLWIILISIPVGLICARFKNGLTDQIIRIVTILGICLPAFWLGYLLLLVFAVDLSWFKVLPEAGVKGYILPSIAMALPVACAVIRLFRASLLTELSSDYVQYAKARGLSSGRILTHHIFRNAMPPIITIFCQYLGYLIAGSAVVESVFSLDGMGSYLINCVTAADAQSAATCIIIVAAVFVIANLIGDVVNRLLCPWMVRENNG